MAKVKVTPRDLEQVMDLQAWLNTSNRVREQKGLMDAFTQGDTDCAFRINEFVGVQRSHADNDWNYWPGDLAQRYHDNGQNYGTYLNFQSENQVVEFIAQTPWKVTVDNSQRYDNRAGGVDFAYKTRHAVTETAVKEVTVTDSVAVGLEAGFTAFGADIKISCTYEHTNARMDSETTTKEREDETTVTVPAGKYFELHVAKKECEKRYRVRVPIVMEGWVGLATGPNRDTTWYTVLPLTDFVSKERVTRWLSVDVNVASVEIEAISYAAPTDVKLTKDKVEAKVKVAK